MKKQKSFKLINLINYIIEDNFFTTLSIISAATTLLLYIFLSKIHLFYICMGSLFIWSMLFILRFYKKESENKEKDEQLNKEYKIPKYNGRKVILFTCLPFILLGDLFLLLLSLTPFTIIIEAWYVAYLLLLPLL